MREAVVICTRNRADDLHLILRSLSSQSGMERRLVLIVDASDEATAVRNEKSASNAKGLRVQYLRFRGKPSLARQRNFAVDRLSEEIGIVHFLDDDVELEPGCLDRLAAAFVEPAIGGVGAKIEVPGKSARKPSIWRRLFLLDSVKPGSVLLSGASTAAQRRAAVRPFETEWLGGCASYRRRVLVQERFDDSLEGYSLDEDVDFSYRVASRHKLMVLPEAVIHHHESGAERPNQRDYARDFLIHRYWFLEKNIRHPLRKAAFWWSALGRLLATRFSSEPGRQEHLAGLAAGARTVWRREHPLLRGSRSEN